MGRASKLGRGSGDALDGEEIPGVEVPSIGDSSGKTGGNEPESIVDPARLEGKGGSEPGPGAGPWTGEAGREELGGSCARAVPAPAQISMSATRGIQACPRLEPECLIRRGPAVG